MGSQYNSITLFTPRDLSNWGTAIPPMLLTASTTTRKFFALMAATSTRSSCSIASMCFCSHVSSVRTLPNSSTGEKEYASFSAIRSTSAPSAALMNSPFSFSNFRAFHCLGLWLAVRMIPASARSPGTAISTVGVVAMPRSITSNPSPTKVPRTMSATIGPLNRASRPSTQMGRSFPERFLTKVPNAAV